MCRSYLFKVAALSCQNPLQADPEPGTGNFYLRTFTMINRLINKHCFVTVAPLKNDFLHDYVR